MQLQREISISRLRKVLPGFCRKFWSNFDSNFPNDDIVHGAQSDVPDVSENFFLQIFFILGFPHLRLSEYFLNIYDKRIPQAPSANCGILILEQIQTRKISFYRVGGGGGVKLLPFSFDLCQPQYFLRRRNMKGQIYTWLAGYFQLKRGQICKTDFFSQILRQTMFHSCAPRYSAMSWS